jgi:hypothetical protein
MIMVLAGPAEIAWPAVNLTVEIKTQLNQITFGDSIAITCNVKSANGIETGAPHPSAESEYMDISNPEADSSAIRGGLKTFHFIVYCFAPDTLSIGPFAVDFKTAEGDSGTVLSNTITIPVKSVLDSTNTKPYPNRIPMEIASKGLPFWLLLLLLLLLAALIFFIIRYYLKKRKKEVTFTVPLTPEDEISGFERLRTMQLDDKELYFMVSTLMRSFIHRNLRFDAVHETTDEILKNMYKKYDNTANADLIKAILIESDTVKFAKYIPGQELRATLIDRALVPVKAILEEIRIRKEQEAAAQKQSMQVQAQKATVKNGGGSNA